MVTPEKIRDREAFLARFEEKAKGIDLQSKDTEPTIRAVFKLLFHRISEGEIQDIKQIFPAELQDLWPMRL
ncbi:MAG: DUF2267 domain-containing protein [Deltaproteobacteria bacterium]|nr:DUF2267 domain-containing protein [Deltaproteobacteria bacterium]